MAMTTRNLSLIFKKVPAALPIPGQDLTIEDRPLNVGSAPSDGFITKNLYASLDPYMRLMLIAPGTNHYRRPFTLNEPLASGSIAEIIQSDHQNYPVGSIIRARLPIQEYTAVTPEWLEAQSQLPEILPTTNMAFALSMWLGPLGMPGQTAYSSIFEIGRPKRNETIFISSAGGAVGSLVGQICKKQGLRVIGSVGSEKKLRSLVDDFGFDDGFNYKTEKPVDALARLCPNGIDIYYDNVGGEQLEAAIDKMNKHGRIVACGMVSQYNKPPAERYGVKNLFQFVGQGLTMRGFLVGDILPTWETRHREDLLKWLEDGSVHVEVDETAGIAKAAEGFVAMIEGKNEGKAVVKLHA